MIGKFPTQVETTTVQVDVELSRTLWRDTTCLSSPMHGAVGLGMVTTCLPKAKDGHHMLCSAFNRVTEADFGLSISKVFVNFRKAKFMSKYATSED